MPFWKWLFIAALILEAAAWLLSGGRPSRKSGMLPPAEGKRLRRLLLAAGAMLMCAYAILTHDYMLLCGQIAVLPILWMRISPRPSASD